MEINGYRDPDQTEYYVDKQQEQRLIFTAARRC